MLRALLALSLALWAGCASAQLMMTGVGTALTGASGNVAYTGPGDIVSGATGWYGFRAYSSAARGNKAANICNVSDVACADVSTSASTGNLVLGTIGGSSCASVTCTVKTLYDQSGNSNDITQATIANRPTVVTSCLGSLPCMQFVRASSQRLATAGNVIANAPMSVSAVAIRTGTVTSFHEFLTAAEGELLFVNSANTEGVFGGTAVSVTANDNAWHAANGVVNAGTACSINVDGTTAGPLSCTASGNSRVISVGSFNNTTTDPLDGKLAEAGIWGSTTFSAGNMTNLCHNQFTYWGTSTSC